MMLVLKMKIQRSFEIGILSFTMVLGITKESIQEKDSCSQGIYTRQSLKCYVKKTLAC